MAFVCPSLFRIDHMRLPLCGRCFLILPGLILATLSLQAKVGELYKAHCMNCHGPGMQGGMAPSMLDDEWRYGDDDQTLADVIANGRIAHGMPAFRDLLSEEEIRALVIYIREKNARALPPAGPESVGDGILRAGGHAFRLETVAEGFETPWAVAFLPDGRLLVTEREGRLWRVDPSTGERVEILGVPEVYARGQGGLLDVEPHPDYAGNGWIYLSYSDPDEVGERSMTAIVRGRISGDRWVDQETVFEAPEDLYTGGGRHFGTRLVFSGEDLFFAIGDRGRRRDAQDLALPNGKTHRIRHDGSVPDDNPFAGRDDAFPTIWTYGNRNQQGLALDPATGRLWSTEHGPRGGDELNLLRRGANYGWPVVTYGMNYNGTPITDRVSAPGMVDPVVHWTPSLAVCGLAYYDGEPFKEWRGDLLSGALAGRELRLLSLDGETVTDQEVLIENKGRIRDVGVGPEGHPYIVFNGPGRVVRMVPAE